MRLRPLAVLILALVLFTSLTAGTAGAVVVPRTLFSAEAAPGGNLTVTALGHVALTSQPVTEAELTDATLTLQADSLAISSPSQGTRTYSDATLDLASGSVRLSRPDGTFRLTLAPTVGLVTAASHGSTGGNATGLLTLRTDSGAFTSRGTLYSLTLAPNATLTLAVGGNATDLGALWTARSHAGERVTLLATGNVTLSARAPVAALTPGSAVVNARITPPTATNLDLVRGLFADDPQVDAPCEGLLREQVREAFLQGGVLLRHGGGNVTTLKASDDSWRITGCSYLRARETTLSVGPGGALEAKGTAVWAYTEATFMGASGVISLGPVPLAAIAFWAVAGGALLVRRLHPYLPPKEPPRDAARISFGLHMGALAVAFMAWDHACYMRYGSSLGGAMWSGTLTWEAFQGLLITEMLPWFLTLAAFAVPVYIATRIFFLYFGCGRPYWGACKAMGLIAAALAGPAHLFFWLNLIASVGLGRFF